MPSASFIHVLLVAQAMATIVLLSRLFRGWKRHPPVSPAHGARQRTACVSIVVPTLDEAARIGPLLEGLRLQGDSVREILFVDSGSTDGTRTLVERSATDDPRIRIERDPPLPHGWIGKAWALHHAASIARSPWLLCLDADTAPRAGLADAVVAAAEEGGYDAVSFAPRFAGQGALERWLQPALLATLVYRLGPPGADTPPERTMANGQCFLVRRKVLMAHGGYEPVRASFAEDVSLARHLALRGVRVGFLDGRLLYDVRSYASAAQMWREWGRSIDLKDAGSGTRQALDIVFLLLVQGLPIPILLGAALGAFATGGVGGALVAVNAALLVSRWAMTRAIAPNYAKRGVSFWLSPLADPLAVIRIVASSIRRPRRWRTREY